ncbi:MAG: HAMP domain-containing sensor histidine kinase [Synergistaceae bacterium]|nr:HAMP domain-containing sensor histidine kinase [Synergistaceae bacterium]
MKRSLRTQMLVQYVVIVIICMLVIPTGISKFLDRQFRLYSSDRLRDDQQEAVRVLEEIYDSDGNWNKEVLTELKGDILRWPMVHAALYDTDGLLIAEFRRSMRHGPMRAPGLKSDNKDTPGFMRSMGPELVMNELPVSSGGKLVGKVRFLCLPFRESREGMFLKKFNSHMVYAIAFMLMIAVIISFIMADVISRPILNVSKRASLISRGKYRVHDDLRSDITELQLLIDSIDRLGLSLEEQEELRKRLMSDIAHELRNPLTIIKSHLEAFEDGVWEPTKERVKLTVDEIDRLSRMVSEIEKLTSIENAGKGLVLESVNLSKEIENAAMTFEPLYSAKSVKLKREIEENVMLAADGNKIRQAVENLLSNALRYTDSGGMSTISLERSSEDVIIRVEDTGIGISAEDLPYIFERFYRTDKSRTRSSGGLGIGLAITKAAVEAHGGSVTAESREGEGSTFTIRLPLA